jgi:hypothetical protein
MATAKKPADTKTLNCVYEAETPCRFTTGEKEFHLVKGVGYELPDCDFVRSLIDQGRLSIKK